MAQLKPVKPLVVYMAHPLGQPPEREINVVKAEQTLKLLKTTFPNFVFVAHYLPLVRVFPEDPATRDLNLRDDFAVLERCDQVWLTGHCFSSGMQEEAKHAITQSIPILDFITWEVGFGQDDLTLKERFYVEWFYSSMYALDKFGVFAFNLHTKGYLDEIQRDSVLGQSEGNRLKRELALESKSRLTTLQNEHAKHGVYNGKEDVGQFAAPTGRPTKRRHFY